MCIVSAFVYYYRRMSASTSTTTTADNKRKSERVANAPLVKRQQMEKKETPRQKWLRENEEWLDTVYQNINDHMKSKYGEDGVKPEGKRSFTNFCEILCEELCAGVSRTLGDESTDDEDEVDGLCSEDEEEPTEEETDEDEEDIMDQLDDEPEETADEEDDE